MKKHSAFPKIGQYRQVVKEAQLRSSYIGKDENGDPMYDHSMASPTMIFKGSVKLHGCFDKDTLVTLSNGEEVLISEINIGDSVLSYDTKKNIMVNKIVTNTQNFDSDKNWLELEFDDGNIIKCTEDHKFYTKNRGWIEASDLTSEDEFIKN
jgi:major membrane immunogen (membrane-anchored lipoprotein)